MQESLSISENPANKTPKDSRRMPFWLGLGILINLIYSIWLNVSLNNYLNNESLSVDNRINSVQTSLGSLQVNIVSLQQTTQTMQQAFQSFRPISHSLNLQQDISPLDITWNNFTNPWTYPTAVQFSCILETWIICQNFSPEMSIFLWFSEQIIASLPLESCSQTFPTMLSFNQTLDTPNQTVTAKLQIAPGGVSISQITYLLSCSAYPAIDI
jgi:hypothetical protein